jgi:hypothetical protein
MGKNPNNPKNEMFVVLVGLMLVLVIFVFVIVNKIVISVIVLVVAQAEAHLVDHTFSIDNEKLELFKQADFVVCILPGTAQTQNFVSTAEFAAMKPDAIFISIGRGNNKHAYAGQMNSFTHLSKSLTGTP